MQDLNENGKLAVIQGHLLSFLPLAPNLEKTSLPSLVAGISRSTHGRHVVHVRKNASSSLTCMHVCTYIYSVANHQE